ncbi:MAG: hypothetical protein AAGK09_03830 [Planctomycetota bacterium]
MKPTASLIVAFLASLLLIAGLPHAKPTNAILILANDISAREIPNYEPAVWSDLRGGHLQDPTLRPRTPVPPRFDLYESEYDLPEIADRSIVD